jgi:hypothetical protein
MQDVLCYLYDEKPTNAFVIIHVVYWL